MKCNPFQTPTPDYKDERTRLDVLETLSKMKQHLETHERIGVSYSGGSDSDCIVHLICTYFPEHLHKIKFVFVNTGLEYRATLKHIAETEARYRIQIDQIRGESVVSVVKREGIPFLSKAKSQRANAYLRGLKWGKRYLYPDAALREKMRNDTVFTPSQLEAVEYCKTNGIKISAKCCDYSKKIPLYNWSKKNGIDLMITGERKAEGGQRALAHTCFECTKHGDRYKPLFWWDNETKARFKAAEGIVYSDCYEVYGLKRTGCVGCPFDVNQAETLQKMFEYEPSLYQACMHVFGQSYELAQKFHCRRKAVLPEYLQYHITSEV